MGDENIRKGGGKCETGFPLGENLKDEKKREITDISGGSNFCLNYEGVGLPPERELAKKRWLEMHPRREISHLVSDAKKINKNSFGSIFPCFKFNLTASIYVALYSR